VSKYEASVVSRPSGTAFRRDADGAFSGGCGGSSTFATGATASGAFVVVFFGSGP
jgi:hypothetical protein